MNCIYLGIKTADIYDRESDSELDEMLDSEYYPTSEDEETSDSDDNDEILFSKSFIIMSDILKKLYYNKDYDSDNVETEEDMSDDSDSDSDQMFDDEPSKIIVAEPAGESLPTKLPPDGHSK